MNSAIVGYLIIAAGAVTVYRLLTAKSGSIQISGIRASWSR